MMGKIGYNCRRLLDHVAAGLAGLLMLGPGCTSVEEHIDEQSDTIQRYYPELSIDPQELSERQLDWDTAVSMLESNLVMRSANEEILKAESAVKRVFLDLIPELTLQGIYSQSISQITELTSENFNANINALFQFPGPLRLRMDYYASMLACFKARKQYELAYREEVVNLYSLFRQYQHLQQSRYIEILESANPYVSTVERSELAFRQNQLERELWLGLSSATGCFTNRWKVVAENLPTYDYLAETPSWNNPEDFGELYVILEAVELEGARLRELGIQFQYWPQLSMRVYSPSVYLLSGGDRGGFEFDAEDIRFEAAVRMRLDTDLKIRDQLREAKRNTDLLRIKLYEDAHERVKKLVDAHCSLRILETRRQQLEARYRFLSSVPDAEGFDLFEKSQSELIEVMKDMLTLETETDSITLILWIAHEERWNPEQIPES
jgi:hypothetical protein